MEPIIWLLGAAPAASGFAYYKLAPDSWKESVKEDVKAAPSAAWHRLRQVRASATMAPGVEVEDLDGNMKVVNPKREMVDFSKQMTDYDKMMKKLGHQQDTNPNREENPNDGIW